MMISDYIDNMPIDSQEAELTATTWETTPRHHLTTPSVSVIIPTLNEEENIQKLIFQIDQSMKKSQITYEIIIIDDHSTDNTIAAVEAIIQETSLPVQIFVKRGQPGKTFSLVEGFAYAQYEVLAMIDADLQYPPQALPTMLKQLKHADIIVGDRRVHYHDISLVRGIMSRTFNALVTTLFGVNTDMQSGLKLFRRVVYNHCDAAGSGWSFDLHLIANALENGFSVANVPIKYCQREAGASKVSPARVALELLQEALQLRITLTTRRLQNQWRQLVNV